MYDWGVQVTKQTICEPPGAVMNYSTVTVNVIVMVSVISREGLSFMMKQVISTCIMKEGERFMLINLEGVYKTTSDLMVLQ